MDKLCSTVEGLQKYLRSRGLEKQASSPTFLAGMLHRMQQDAEGILKLAQAEPDTSFLKYIDESFLAPAETWFNRQRAPVQNALMMALPSAGVGALWEKFRPRDEWEEDPTLGSMAAKAAKTGLLGAGAGAVLGAISKEPLHQTIALALQDARVKREREGKGMPLTLPQATASAAERGRILFRDAEPGRFGLNPQNPKHKEIFDILSKDIPGGTLASSKDRQDWASKGWGVGALVDAAREVGMRDSEIQRILFAESGGVDSAELIKVIQDRYAAEGRYGKEDDPGGDFYRRLEQYRNFTVPSELANASNPGGTGSPPSKYSYTGEVLKNFWDMVTPLGGGWSNMWKRNFD